MMYHASGMGVGWWSFIAIALVLPVLVLAAGLVFAQFQRPADKPGPQRPDAEEVLADRLARGEIGAEEYEQRLHALRAARR
jgi:putative membrane protein